MIPTEHTHGKAAQKSRTRWRDYIFDLAWHHFGLEPAKPSEIAAWKLSGFVSPHGAVASVTLLRGKAGGKINELLASISIINYCKRLWELGLLAYIIFTYLHSLHCKINKMDDECGFQLISCMVISIPAMLKRRAYVGLYHVTNRYLLTVPVYFQKSIIKQNECIGGFLTFALSCFVMISLFALIVWFTMINNYA